MMETLSILARQGVPGDRTLVVLQRTPHPLPRDGPVALDCALRNAERLVDQRGGLQGMIRALAAH